MTITADRIPENWQRAMQRAHDNRLQAIKITDRLYTVQSVSGPGTRHLVNVSAAGKVKSCGCKGWTHYSCCQHAGAVARRLMRERGIRVGAASAASSSAPVAAVESGCRGRSQLFQEEAA
jgi:hypothetical protein